MKLLFCPHCTDVRKLPIRAPGMGAGVCECGKSWGYYTDDINAVYGGDAVMLGFANSSLAGAIQAQRKYGDTATGQGRTFEAFIIPESAPSVKREADNGNTT